ncbi:hypothetical protein MHW47_05155 [Streptomyces sp. OfavH-34-F]|uniref:hypothetical protein n=1 Tax=Streptomyces sp. OfavH-34-F TaxID=2917760 RepID=UPI001EF317E8|nr:hypothetical protein [Streptomyces sp. OfavH-34-F]MCG7523836.1 hypothetical protein [Streptomyces sp. OfavH-34-F]
MRTPPFVLPWAGETVLPATLRTDHDGVSYVDPDVDRAHRDDDGVLWEAWGGRQTGARIYTRLQPDRQHRAMRLLLCATCGRSAGRTAEGMLWLLPLLDGPPAEGTSWEDVQTTVPPSCEECADRVTLQCPWLRDGYVRLRVREAPMIGVRGTLYPRTGEPGPPEDDVAVRYDSPDARYVVAQHAVRELRLVTVEAVVPPRPEDRTPGLCAHATAAPAAELGALSAHTAPALAAAVAPSTPPEPA